MPDQEDDFMGFDVVCNGIKNKSSWTITADFYSGEDGAPLDQKVTFINSCDNVAEEDSKKVQVEVRFLAI